MGRMSLLVCMAALAAPACLPPPGIIDNDAGADADTDTGNGECGGQDCTELEYLDDLASHPGCTTEDLAYTPASIPGYQCAAAEYVGTEDPSQPIVILVHGNSDDVGVWEAFTDESCDPRGPEQGAPMLSERLVEAGYRTYAVDMRSDKICEMDRCDCDDITICNFTRTMDHGWGVPIVMHLVQSVLEAFPDRQIAILGHSYGVTTVRDTLRRLYQSGYPIYERVDDVVLLSGPNHGVSSYCGYDCCGQCANRRGSCACELGFRDAYDPTCFMRALNGPGGAWETPCADGATAFGCADACNGHQVSYTTIVMQDETDGSQRDLCVSEASAELSGASNLTISLDSPDRSDYFYCTFLQNHFGTPRSAEAMSLIVNVLSD